MFDEEFLEDEFIDDDNVVLSDLAKREQLRKEIHKTVGDAESLFSIDSDLLQIITYLLIQLVETMQSEEVVNIKDMTAKLDPAVLNTLNLLSDGLKDQSLIFPIDVKRQYKSEEEILSDVKNRYTKTSACLSKYYVDGD